MWWDDLADNVLHVRGSVWGATKTGRTRPLTLPTGEVAALRAFRTREGERAGRLDHASPTTTMQTYSHLIGRADPDAAERLEALLSRSPG